jgi:hypothetical protein
MIASIFFIGAHFMQGNSRAQACSMGFSKPARVTE